MERTTGEAATRDALAWVLAELQRMLDNSEAAPSQTF